MGESLPWVNEEGASEDDGALELAPPSVLLVDSSSPDSPIPSGAANISKKNKLVNYSHIHRHVGGGGINGDILMAIFFLSYHC